MKFIEVTDYDRGLKCLISADKISSVVCDGDGSVFIEMGVDNKGVSVSAFGKFSSSCCDVATSDFLYSRIRFILQSGFIALRCSSAESP